MQMKPEEMRRDEVTADKSVEPSKEPKTEKVEMQEQGDKMEEDPKEPTTNKKRDVPDTEPADDAQPPLKKPHVGAPHTNETEKKEEEAANAIEVRQPTPAANKEDSKPTETSAKTEAEAEAMNKDRSDGASNDGQETATNEESPTKATEELKETAASKEAPTTESTNVSKELEESKTATIEGKASDPLPKETSTAEKTNSDTTKAPPSTSEPSRPNTRRATTTAPVPKISAQDGDSATKAPRPSPSIAPTKKGGALEGTSGGAKAKAKEGTSVSTSKPTSTSSSRRKPAASEKPLKGLRHFSMMVCKKVEEKKTTTYNQVADELVKKVMDDRRSQDPHTKFDEKNIRRRVYDSINVLLAMDIISKEKKQITWKGLPSRIHQDLQLLEREEEFRQQQVKKKRRALQEILTQQICFRNLVTRNKEREAEMLHAEKVPLPFIVVNTHKEAIIQCNMAPDLDDVTLDFDKPFEINDDNLILTRLGMHQTDLPTLREMVPEDLVNYCQEHGLLDSVLGDRDTDTDAELSSPTPRTGRNRGQYFRSLE